MMVTCRTCGPVQSEGVAASARWGAPPSAWRRRATDRTVCPPIALHPVSRRCHGGNQVTATRRFQPRVVARASSNKTETKPTVTVSLPTQDAQEALRFDVYPEGRGQAVRVSQVAAGSEAEAAGVQVGQKLRAISDPVRQGEMWTLGDAPSVRFVRDALRLRRSGVVELVLEELAPGEAEAAAAAAAADAAEQLRAAAARAEMDPATAATSSTLDALMGTPGAAGNASVDGTAAGSGGGMTIAEKMMLQQQAAERAKGTVGDVRRRIERRQAYLDEMNKRNDSGYIALALALFILPAAIILLTAYFTGYLDQLYMNSLTRN